MMVRFCNDSDIIKYESILFGELYLPGQILVSGTGGLLSGSTFTVSGEDFSSCSVESGGAIYLRSGDGILDGVFEIVSVDSADQLTVSVIRGQSSDSVISPPAGSSIFYRVSTLSPQANEVGLQLMEYFGLGASDPLSSLDSDDIVETSCLKQVSVFAVISSVYAMLASEGKDEIYWKKSQHYQRLFSKSLQRCRIGIDAGGDGKADIILSGGSIRLVRD